MIWRILLAGAVAGCTAQAETNTSLQQAMRNYPPLIMGANTIRADGTPPYARACAVGGRVEQRGGPNFEYLGPSPSNPDLCRMRIGGKVVEGWYGIWLDTWPGAAAAYPALTRIIRGRTGDVEAFDTIMASPGLHFHDLIRNEGIESIPLLGKTYLALKLSHYREGFDGNIYRSVATVWKDLRSGMLLYGTYQHISGTPEIDDPLLPSAIIPPG